MAGRDGSSKGKDPLITGQVYHVYNRGVGGQITFPDAEAYTYLLQLLDHCLKFTTPLSLHRRITRTQDEKIHRFNEPSNPRGLKEVPVKIHAYTLMPNHFHLLIEQLADGGIKDYVGRICNSYTKAYNERFRRQGPLWQGRFKAIVVTTNQSFLQVIRYIHLNPLHSSFVRVKDLRDYPYSSFIEVVKAKKNILCDNTRLRELIPSPREYEEFVRAGIDEGAANFIKEAMLEQFFAD